MNRRIGGNGIKQMYHRHLTSAVLKENELYLTEYITNNIPFRKQTEKFEIEYLSHTIGNFKIMEFIMDALYRKMFIYKKICLSLEV